MYLKGTSQTFPMHFDVWKTFLAKFIFTFALCYVLNTAYSKATKGNSFIMDLLQILQFLQDPTLLDASQVVHLTLLLP